MIFDGGDVVALHLALCPHCLFDHRAVSLVRAEVSTVNKRKMEIRMERLEKQGGEKKERGRKNTADCKKRERLR